MFWWSPEVPSLTSRDVVTLGQSAAQKRLSGSLRADAGHQRLPTNKALWSVTMRFRLLRWR